MRKQADGPLDWTGDWGAVPAVGLGALALGAGGRLAKNLYDISQGDPADSSVGIGEIEAPVSNIPIEVTPEEAEELERQGFKVKKVLAKRASESDGPDPLKAIGYGALGTGMALGGWHLTDYIIDRIRKSQAKTERDRVKKRIRKLLEGTPDNEDVAIYSAMKTASAKMMVKEALIGELLAGGGLLVGGGALLQALAGFRKAKRENKYRGKIKGMKKLLQRRKIQTPQAAMQPVVVLRDDEEEEEESREEPTAIVQTPSPAPAPQAVQAPTPAAAPKIQPVQVVRQSGSPAQQARSAAQAVSGSWI